MKKIPLMRLLIILLVLVSASLACNLPASGSNPPPTQAAGNPEDAQQFEDNLKATLANPNPSDEITITITQQQMTAFVREEVDNQPEKLISDPQVVLTSGQMEVFGKVSQFGITTDARAVLTPRIDADGNPRLNVVSLNLGAFPVPGTLKERVGEMVDNAVSDYLASHSNRFRVTKITISEGLMTVTGVPR